MIEAIKKIHKEDIVLVKIGTFYNAYGKDAYILSYLFNYKLNKVQDTYTSAFPVNSLNKIRAGLERSKINYIIVDRRNNYDIEEESNNKKQNKYNKILEDAKREITTKKRIARIVKQLEENIEIIEKVETLMMEYERREI